MKKIFSLWLVLFCVVSFAACSPAETPEQRVERVLTQVFTCPDEGTQAYADVVRESLSSMDQAETQGKLLRAEETLGKYVREKYDAEDFTDSLYENLYTHLYTNLVFPTVCAMSDITVKPERISVEPESEAGRAYAYTAELAVEKDGEMISVLQEGKVQVDENGRISFFDLTGSALYDVVMG